MARTNSEGVTKQGKRGWKPSARWAKRSRMAWATVSSAKIWLRSPKPGFVVILRASYRVEQMKQPLAGQRRSKLPTQQH